MIVLMGQCGQAYAAQGGEAYVAQRGAARADAGNGPARAQIQAQAPVQVNARVQADASPASRNPAILHFDLPRQPLQSALDQFHALTGQSLLYDGAIAEGGWANPVQGDMRAAEALDRLLAGTGIAARYTSGDAFMLMRSASAGAAAVSDSGAEPGTESAAALLIKRNYYGLLQAQVLAALCGDPATIPGSYRLALNLWVRADRSVERAVMHPTGNPRRDVRISKVLAGLTLQSAPPAGVVQPITLLILPRAPSETGDCSSASAPTSASAPAATSAAEMTP